MACLAAAAGITECDLRSTRSCRTLLLGFPMECALNSPRQSYQPQWTDASMSVLVLGLAQWAAAKMTPSSSCLRRPGDAGCLGQPRSCSMRQKRDPVQSAMAGVWISRRGGCAKCGDERSGLLSVVAAGPRCADKCVSSIELPRASHATHPCQWRVSVGRCFCSEIGCARRQLPAVGPDP